MNPTDIRDQAHAVRLENAKSPQYSQAVEDLCNNVGLLVLEHVGVCAELTEWKEKHTIVVEKYNLACEENTELRAENERMRKALEPLVKEAQLRLEVLGIDIQKAHQISLPVSLSELIVLAELDKAHAASADTGGSDGDE